MAIKGKGRPEIEPNTNESIFLKVLFEPLDPVISKKPVQLLDFSVI